MLENHLNALIGLGQTARSTDGYGFGEGAIAHLPDFSNKSRGAEKAFRRFWQMFIHPHEMRSDKRIMRFGAKGAKWVKVHTVRIT